MQMTSRNPYLIRATYEWIVDNGLTPYMLIHTNYENVWVPEKYINEDGSIILNISGAAVFNLKIDNQSISFNGSFDGVAQDVYAPIEAVIAVYAAENGFGIVLESEQEENGELSLTSNTNAKSDDALQNSDLQEKVSTLVKNGKPNLRIVK